MNLPHRWDAMGRVEYVIPLGDNARKRHFHDTARGTVIACVVQLEVLLEGDWFPVVRYDSKHGFAHVDWITRSGETQKQLLPLPFAEALTHADKDILDRWRDYQLHFYQGD